MQSSTTTTTNVSSSVAQHTLSFRGPSGVTLILLIAAAIVCVLGFSTNGWHKYNYNGYDREEGLWEICTCAIIDTDGYPWFTATQAMMTIGLIGVGICLILSLMYMCIHTVSKNSIIIALVITCFMSVLFILIGLIIYGTNKKEANWSYAMMVIGGAFTLAAGISSVIQMTQSGVKWPCF